MLGTNSVVLHGHLPWVHHPQYEEFLEEDWYLEALAETYLPLLITLDDLAADRVPVRLAVGVTPTLLEMLRSPALQQKADRYLLRRIELAEKEVGRQAGKEPYGRAAIHYLKRFGQLWDTWTRAGRDLVAEFRRHQEEGRLEILASCATHAVLPLVHTEEGRRAQIAIGVALYEEVFGRAPAGFWLPECAYAPGIDTLLAEAKIQWVVLEAHGVTGASPASRFGVHRPIRLPSGVAAFGRDPTSSRQVWATEVGYPGDPEYRELYRDLGFDGAYADIRPYLHQDGVRRNLGIKYHRVTGKVSLDAKEPWDPDGARGRTKVHAGNFLWHRGEQASHFGRDLREPVSILSPYDLELFGHWWYEGPWFIENLFRQMQERTQRPPVRLVTPSEVLREAGPIPEAQAPLSTWGEDGYLKVWLNEENAFVLRHQHEIERRMIERVRDWPDPDPDRQRILDQMLRELLLLQSSDWAFILTRQTQVHYAKKRVTDHVARFLELEAALADPTSLDEEWWVVAGAEDALFPGLDHRVIIGGAAVRNGGALGTPAPA